MSGDHNMHCSGNQPDIVERLRRNTYGNHVDGPLMHEAADEIECLRTAAKCLVPLEAAMGACDMVVERLKHLNDVVYNNAIEDAARIPYGMGDEGCYQQIMELKK